MRRSRFYGCGKFEYRRLTADDVALALGMNETFRAGLVEESAAKSFLQSPQNWLLCAIGDGKVVGFAYGYALDRLDRSERMLYVHEVGVAEGFRRRGVGCAMMRALGDDCRASGVFKYFLLTSRHNAPANALYRKLGGGVSPESNGEDVCYTFLL